MEKISAKLNGKKSLVAIFNVLIDKDDKFLEKLQEKHGGWWSLRRSFISEDQKKIHLKSPHLNRYGSSKLANGWFIDTHLSVKEMKRRVIDACKVAMISPDSIIPRENLLHPQYDNSTHIGLKWTGYTFLGTRYPVKAANELLVRVFNHFIEENDMFVDELRKRQPGWWSGPRNFISKNKKDIHMSNPQPNEYGIGRLKDGWFISTNLSAPEIKRRIYKACEVAKVVPNIDLILHQVDKFELDPNYKLRDIKHLIDNRIDIEPKLRRRGEDTAYFDILTNWSVERKQTILELNELQAQRKEFNRNISAAKRPPNDTEREQMHESGEQVKKLEEKVRGLESDIHNLYLTIPNIPLDSVPDGLTEEFNKVVGEQPPVTKAAHGLAHWDIAPRFQLMDMEAGASLSGERFYLLKNQGARLHRALLNWLLDININEFGYSEVLPPLLVRQETMIGSGNLPKFRDNLYHDDETDLWLIPTAEVSLNGIWQDKIIPHGELPFKYVAATPCFRKEHTAAGRDVRGIKRVHQFEKVEMFRVEEPAKSDAVLLEMVEQVKTLCRRLGLTYRVLELCAGDIGFQSAHTFDIEIWAPGVGDWLEVSSVSTCGDFQARRNNTRYRPTADSKPTLPHTLNGSALALPRVWAAILEAGLRPDQSTIDIPAELHPYTGFESIQLP